ncbi:MAG: ribonuclease HII [Phycisphaerae bacterium]|nr:ribonuclease HII [Phycisphaerae bacterium]|tara:strand:+ start:613 stop:1344 length:732 start_codon:yes stop_codon:yes gene_type:complete
MSQETQNTTNKTRRTKQQPPLNKWFDYDSSCLEIGIDEAGRGPMLGRVYAAAVILPKEGDFKHDLMKDSKRFHSDKKIREAAEYIKKNAIAYHVAFSSEETIDQINIRNATHRAMHDAIRELIKPSENYQLLVDGNDFKPFTTFSDINGLVQIPHICIEGGDNKYTAIAAASILAKVERDNYIAKICNDNPELDVRYDILKNKGYGTKTHHEGIYKYGITKYHRKTFGVCRNYTVVNDPSVKN